MIQEKTTESTNEVFPLGTSFKDLITVSYKMANPLNYTVSTIGDC